MWLHVNEWFTGQQIWDTAIFLSWVLLSWNDIFQNIGYLRGISSLRKFSEFRGLNSSSFHLIHDFVFEIYLTLYCSFDYLHEIYLKLFCPKKRFSTTRNLTILRKLWLSFLLERKCLKYEEIYDNTLFIIVFLEIKTFVFLCSVWTVYWLGEPKKFVRK